MCVCTCVQDCEKRENEEGKEKIQHLVSYTLANVLYFKYKELALKNYLHSKNERFISKFTKIKPVSDFILQH